jgi:hypothetical protein
VCACVCVCVCVIDLVSVAFQTVYVVQEFHAKPLLVPHQEYNNTLYVYLDYANLAGRTATPSARNIAVRVQLKQDDRSVSDSGLMAIYARNGALQLETQTTSWVTYHSKQPQFYDEIKINLPANLTHNHHLLFTFYHINVQQTKAKGPTAEVPVGYAVLQLYANDKYVLARLIAPLH